MNMQNLSNELKIKLALACVYEVKHLIKDPRSLGAIKLAELCLEGKTTKSAIKNAVQEAYHAWFSLTQPFPTSDAKYATAYATYAVYQCMIVVFSAICEQPDVSSAWDEGVVEAVINCASAGHVAFVASNPGTTLNHEENKNRKFKQLIDSLTGVEKALYE